MPGQSSGILPEKGRCRQERGTGKIVRLSLAVALLLPISEAYAQFDLNCTRPIQFGSFAPCGGGGSVTVTPATGNVTTAGCVVLLGTPKQALCSVKSFATSGSIQVKLSAKTTNIAGPGVMQVKSFNIATAGGGPTRTWTSAALTATPLSFGVGGKIAAGGGQLNGNYSGSLIMTVMFTP